MMGAFVRDDERKLSGDAGRVTLGSPVNGP